MNTTHSILLSTGVQVYFQRDDMATDLFNCFTLDDEGEPEQILFCIDTDLGVTDDNEVLSEEEIQEFSDKFYDFIHVLCIPDDMIDTFTITRRNKEDEMKLKVDYEMPKPFSFEINGASASYGDMQDMLSDVADTLHSQDVVLTVEQKAELLDYLFDMSA